MHIVQDHLSGTSSVVDSAGNATRIRYGVWGEARDAISNLPTSRLYTGQEKSNTGLFNYNARWYDSYLNRWLQPDSIIPDSYNPLDYDRYSYVRNNPINFNDPTGHDVGCPASNPACLGISGHANSKEYKNYVAKAKQDQAALRAYLRKTDAFKPIADIGLTSLPGLPPRKDVPAPRCLVGTNGPKLDVSSHPVQEIEIPKDEITGVTWGWNGSASGLGPYYTGGQEEIVVPGNRATFNYIGYGTAYGTGGSASAYGGVLINVQSPEDYQGLTSAAGVTLSVLDVGLTAGYFWSGAGSPLDIGSPKGFIIGYAPGAQFSIWETSVYYQETWRAR